MDPRASGRGQDDDLLERDPHPAAVDCPRTVRRLAFTRLQGLLFTPALALSTSAVLVALGAPVFLAVLGGAVAGIFCYFWYTIFSSVIELAPGKQLIERPTAPMFVAVNYVLFTRVVHVNSVKAPERGRQVRVGLANGKVRAMRRRVRLVDPPSTPAGVNRTSTGPARRVHRGDLTELLRTAKRVGGSGQISRAYLGSQAQKDLLANADTTSEAAVREGLLTVVVDKGPKNSIVKMSESGDQFLDVYGWWLQSRTAVRR